MLGRSLLVWVAVLGCGPADPGTTDDSTSDAGLDTDKAVVTETDVPQDSGEPPVVVPEEDDRLVFAPVQCADPSRRDERRFDRFEIGNDWEFHPTYGQGPEHLEGGWGVGIGDLNGDGDLDLVVPRWADTKVLLGDGAGGFVDDTVRAFDGNAIGEAVGVSLADAEGDGDVDFVLLREKVPNLMFINDGTGVFERMNLDDAMEYPGCGCVASWGDVDLDNRLDLFVGRVTRATGQNEFIDCPSSLFMQNADGTWRDEWEMLSDDVHAAIAFGSGFLNLDDDIEPELYVVSDRGAQVGGNRVLDNIAGVLTQIDGHSLNISTSGMGLGIGDLNDDGIWDVIVPALGKNFMMVSDAPSGLWFDGATYLELQPDLDRDQASGWGGEICDINNDARLDVLMAYGTVRLKEFDEGSARHAEVQPDEIYLGQPNGKYQGVAENWGLDDGFATRGTVIADINTDGYLDIVKREYGGIVVVYLSRCGDQGWLEVELDWDTPNRFGIGAEVTVEADGVRHRRLINAGSTGTTSGGPPFAHFGLAQADVIDSLVVAWPDGVEESFTADAGIATRQVVTIHRD